MDISFVFKKLTCGNSLVVQWLGLGTFTAGARVRSLVRGTKIRQAAKKKMLICMEARFLYCFLKKALNLSTKNPFEDSTLEIFVIYVVTEI